jgi:hypothetical protein
MTDIMQSISSKLETAGVPTEKISEITNNIDLSQINISDIEGSVAYLTQLLTESGLSPDIIQNLDIQNLNFEGLNLENSPLENFGSASDLISGITGFFN